MQANTFLQRAVNATNGRVAALAASPRWGRLLGRKIVLITYTGRRSGRSFTTPVGYRRTRDGVTIGVQLPDAKNWWRNFLDEGGPLTLHLDGVDRAGHAVARRDGRGRVSVDVSLREP